MAVSQEILFAKTLEEVRKMAKEQGNNISSKQVKEAFSELGLEEAQLEMVFDYLKKNKIGIDAPVDLDEYLSEEETDYLEEYKKELLSLPVYRTGEIEGITLSAMAGEKDAQQKLIHIYLPKVVEISKLYTGQGVFLEDLIGEGNIALTVGVTMLGCLEHAKEAESMLIKMVMDGMEECIARNLEESGRDKKVADRVNEVAEKARELAEELHRKVTAEELSKESGISEEDIKDAIRVSGYAIEDIEG